MERRENTLGWMLALEVLPAAIFGGASSFSAATFLKAPLFALLPLGIGIAAFCAICLTLRAFRGSPAMEHHPIAEFQPPEIEVEQTSVSELLTQADVAALVDQLSGRPFQVAEEEVELEGTAASSVDEPAQADELVLDDILEAVEQDSRVIRLFEPDGTPGELQSRIDRHLRDRPAPDTAQADATQELHEALAALRRSLR